MYKKYALVCLVAAFLVLHPNIAIYNSTVGRTTIAQTAIGYGNRPNVIPRSKATWESPK